MLRENLLKTPLPVTRNVFHEELLSSRDKKCEDNVFGNFLVQKGLYEEIEITKENIFELADLVGGHVKIDVFCPKCGKSRVFTCETIPYFTFDTDRERIEHRTLEEELVLWQELQKVRETPKESWTWTETTVEQDTRLMVFKFACTMNPDHHLDYVVITDKNKMKKIGQYPSVADLSFPELKEYRKVISQEDERELRRAIGLYASGIGVGSFVYLRRVFERIIISASQIAIEAGVITEEDFAKAHVDEKIKMLKEYLPKSLVDNSMFYGIVSKGIHELSEDDCLRYFSVLKYFIFIILRQWEKERKDREEMKQIESQLSKIASNIK